MKITLAILFGGRSVEHEVSVISALQAIQNIDTETYNIVPVYVSKEGKWYTGEVLLEVSNYRNSVNLKKNAQQVYFTPAFDDGYLYFIEKGRKNKPIAIDVAFPIFHGTFGEDGAIQGLLELKGLPFVGCDVLSAAITMDKIITKQVLESSGIPVVDYCWFYDQEWHDNPHFYIQKIEQNLGYPVVIKPANLGSSVGISKANNQEALKEAIEYALLFSQKLIVEKAIIPLKEINCSVLGDCESATTSVLEEPLNTGDFLSYEDKYMSGGSSKTDTSNEGGVKSTGMSSLQRKIPADISESMATEIKQYALKTFRVLGDSGVSRIDFLVDEPNQKVYVNEVNPIPGSLSFYLWEPTGKKYKTLLNDMIKIALKRYREQNNLTLSFDKNLFDYASENAMKGKGGKH